MSHWSEGQISTDGGNHTVNRGQFLGRGTNPYQHIHGAGYRAVYDLSNPANSRFSIWIGRSGNVLSQRYMGQLQAWRDGRNIRIMGAKQELKIRNHNRLLLKPVNLVLEP